MRILINLNWERKRKILLRMGNSYHITEIKKRSSKGAIGISCEPSNRQAQREGGAQRRSQLAAHIDRGRRRCHQIDVRITIRNGPAILWRTGKRERKRVVQSFLQVQRSTEPPRQRIKRTNSRLRAKRKAESGLLLGKKARHVRSRVNQPAERAEKNGNTARAGSREKGY